MSNSNWDIYLTHCAGRVFEWLNPPEFLHQCPCQNAKDCTECDPLKGRAWVAADGQQLVIRPPSKSDFWCRTFYQPEYISTNAPSYVTSIDKDESLTFLVDVSFKAISQFDQAGLVVYLDSDHWLKCGIEYCDGKYSASAVVTNVFSDWSTKTWPSSEAGIFIRIKLHKIAFNSSFCIELAEHGSDAFEFFRICHLSSQTFHPALTKPIVPDLPFQIGHYACCPTAQAGFEARFSNFQILSSASTTHHNQIV